MDFKFELNARVGLRGSNETGIVVGRADYSADENRYLVRYKAGDSRLVEQWWQESALEAR